MDSYSIYIIGIGIIDQMVRLDGHFFLQYHSTKLKLNLYKPGEREFRTENFLKYCDSIIQEYRKELIKEYNDSIITNVSYSIGFTENLGVSGQM